MSWLIAGTAGAGLIKGVADGRANRKQQKQLDASRKATIMYSPWTGLGDPGAQSAGPTGLSSALGGAVNGALLGQSIQGLGGFGGGKSPLKAMSTGNTQNVGMVSPAMKTGGSAGSMGGSVWGGMNGGAYNPMKMYS